MPRVTKKNSPIILLFEDNPIARRQRCGKIAKVVGHGTQVVPYEDTRLPAENEHAIEFRLFEDLSKQAKYGKGNIGLIVCDRALDRYKEFQAASETVVSAAARMLGVPICLYERGDNPHGIRLMQRRPWEKDEIIIDGDGSCFAEECAALYAGFRMIREYLARLSSAAFRKMTPAEILADILNKPEETDRIALYGAGEQGLLQEIMPFLSADENPDVNRLKAKHYPRVIGNWLFSSVLRFPGILVDKKAASSLLNIDPEDLVKKPALRKLFASAEYKGPFADDSCGWQWWWRRDLETLVSKAEMVSGLELAKKKGFRGVRGCNCCEGEDHAAGFVCMISGEPVCEEHSRGGISWFPGGADLARVRTSVYKKIGPFLGLY